MAKPDWEAIETAYRAGIMSLREIGTAVRQGTVPIKKYPRQSRELLRVNAT